MLEVKVNAVSTSANLIIEGFEKSNTILLRETKFTIDNAFDICCNDYHIETYEKNEIEYLYIISTVSNKKHILEKHIRVIEIHAIMDLKFTNPNIFAI